MQTKVQFYTENGRFEFLSPPPPWVLRGNTRCSS